jgi:glutathione S-transferase
MKLRYSPTSPYVRKVLVVAYEAGLEGRIERVATNLADPASGLTADNPLGKIPALITDGGEVLYDSPVICEYLDSLHDGRRLFPAAGGGRWKALRRQALADGILDAGVLRMMEMRRPENERSAAWMVRQKGVVVRGLDALEEEAADLDAEPVTIGHIAIGCALGWLDFRLPDDEWRDGRQRLARWYQGFAERRSMLETVPREPA